MVGFGSRWVEVGLEGLEGGPCLAKGGSEGVKSDLRGVEIGPERSKLDLRGWKWIGGGICWTKKGTEQV